MKIMKLKGRMSERGITQSALAKTIGLSKNTMSSRFTGQTSFTVNEAEKICLALGIDEPEEKAQIFLSESSQY